MSEHPRAPVCISACDEKERLGIKHGLCAPCVARLRAMWRAELRQRDDLLAALKQMASLYDGLDDAIGASVRAKVDAARAAIQKAEGHE